MVSVIIPTRNEEENIEECLNSVNKQSYKKIEIVVVDGGSNDNTVKIALKNGARVIHERPSRGPGNARNIGAKAAHGDIVAFVDADNVMERGYIEKSLNFLFKNKKIHGISSNTLMYPTNDLIPNLYFTERLSARSGFSPTIIWRNIFLKVLFDPTLGIGEDYDMSRRFVAKGFRYSFLKNIRIFHKEPNFKRILTESRWWGRTYWILLKKKYLRITFSFIWTAIVALLLPGMILAYFIPLIKPFMFLLIIIFSLHSFFKILFSLNNGAKLKYVIFLPAFKIFRYTFLFMGILLGIFSIKNKKKFSGE